MTTARATRNEYGFLISNEEGLDFYNMRTEPMHETRPKPHSLYVRERKKCKLGALLGSVKYDLLVRHILKEHPFWLEEDCAYGYRGIIRSIIVRGVDYRADGYRMANKREEIDDE